MWLPLAQTVSMLGTSMGKPRWNVATFLAKTVSMLGRPRWNVDPCLVKTIFTLNINLLPVIIILDVNIYIRFIKYVQADVCATLSA